MRITRQQAGRPGRGGRAARLAVAGAAAAMAGAVPAATGPAAAAASSHPSAATLATHASDPAVMVDCGNRLRVAPRRFVLACADGNGYLAQMTWVRWGGAAASGRGTEMINNCTPDCAAGRFVSYPVSVTVWRARPLPGSRARYFTRLTTVYPRKRPVVGGKPVRAATWPLWSRI